MGSFMLTLTNSHSLSDFQRNARSFLQDINEKKEPLILTVNGKIQGVLVDPETYQHMEEMQERARFLAALKEGIEDLEAGNAKPAEEVFEELRVKHGL